MREEKKEESGPQHTSLVTVDLQEHGHISA